MQPRSAERRRVLALRSCCPSFHHVSKGLSESRRCCGGGGICLFIYLLVPLNVGVSQNCCSLADWTRRLAHSVDALLEDCFSSVLKEQSLPSARKCSLLQQMADQQTA